jgi:peptidoglycan/LPS O-acetylase OafA/YrhL
MPQLQHPRNPRYQSLDIWRGVACLMVVVFHASLYGLPADPPSWQSLDPATGWVAGIVSKLWLGVPFFFVISGYCIAVTSDSARRKPRALAHFFVRRFRRIFPPYWCACLATLLLLAAVWAVGWPPLFQHTEGFVHLENPTTFTAGQWLGNGTLTESWLSQFTTGHATYILGQAWSLCYEEQFYALCGLLLLLSPRFFFTGAAAITACTLLLLPFSLSSSGEAWHGFFFDGRWLLFALGVLIYYKLNYPPTKYDCVLLLLFLLGPLLFLLCLFLPAHAFASNWPITLSFELTAGSVFGMALLGLHPADERLIRSRWLKPLAFCGKMCYSLYLVHWPIAELVGHALFLLGVRSPWATFLLTVPAVTLVSVGVAWLFHVAVERRFLNPSVIRDAGREKVPVSVICPPPPRELSLGHTAPTPYSAAPQG